MYKGGGMVKGRGMVKGTGRVKEGEGGWEGGW